MATATKIILVNPRIIEMGPIDTISGVLDKEGVIVYPTETFYGLGASIFSRKAIQRIYRLKKRIPSKPLPIVISDFQMLEDIVVGVPPLFQPIVSKLWPGPLTIVLKGAPHLPEELKGASGSIGVRLTGYPWLRALVRHAGFPITATSANLTGEREISQPGKVIDVFRGKVDLIVDGGKTEGKIASTVVDLTGKNPSLIREGAIPFSQIQKIF